MNQIRHPSRSLFALSVALFASSASAQTVDAFEPHPQTYPTSVALQGDGRAIIVGNFLSVDATARARVARLDADGSVDMTFVDPSVDSEVKTVAIQPDGKVLIGGSFTQVGGQVRHSLARLNDDGTLDTGFADPMLDSTVWTIALQPDGRIIAGGDFTHVGATPRDYIVRIEANGGFDSSFPDPQLCCSVVRSVALQPDGHVLVGGAFTHVGSVEHAYLARFSSAGAFDPSFPDVSESIVLFANDMLVTPDGSTLLGSSSSPSVRKLKIDGTLDDTFVGTDSDGSVYSIGLQPNGKFVIAGTFGTVGGQPHHGLARLNADGSVDPTFADLHLSVSAGDVNGYAYGVASQTDGNAIVIGNFSLAGGQSRSFVARVVTGDRTVNTLHAQPSGTSAIVTWTRSGAGPELAQPPTILLSANGTTFTGIGPMARVAGGWQATIPHDLHGTPFHLRADGLTSTGADNGSLGVVSSPVISSDTIFADGFD